MYSPEQRGHGPDDLGAVGVLVAPDQADGVGETGGLVEHPAGLWRGALAPDVGDRQNGEGGIGVPAGTLDQGDGSFVGAVVAARTVAARADDLDQFPASSGRVVVRGDSAGADGDCDPQSFFSSKVTSMPLRMATKSWTSSLMERLSWRSSATS